MRFAGIVRDGVIVLEPETKLPDGTEVSITPVTSLDERLRDYRKRDHGFEAAIAAFAEAEAREVDPLEGEVVDLSKDAEAREQFRQILAGWLTGTRRVHAWRRI